MKIFSFKNVLAYLVLLSTVFSAAAQNFQTLSGDALDNRFTLAKELGSGVYAMGLQELGTDMTATFSHYLSTGSQDWLVGLQTGSVWNDFVETSSGDILVVGQTTTSGPDNECLLMKISASGTVQFIRRYNLDSEEGFLKIAQSMNPANAFFPYYLVGTQKASGIAPKKVFMINLDENGVFNWKKIIGGGTTDWETGHAMIPILNGGFGLFGNANNGTDNATMVITDNLGVVSASFSLGSTLSILDAEYSYLNDEGFYICGEHSGTGYYARINTAGNQSWAYELDGQGACTHLVRDNLSSVWVLGTKAVGAVPAQPVFSYFYFLGLYPWRTWYLSDNETSITEAGMTMTPDGYLLFADGRSGNADGYGGNDGFLCRIDTTQLLSCMTHPLTQTFTTINLNSPVAFGAVSASDVIPAVSGTLTSGPVASIAWNDPCLTSSLHVAPGLAGAVHISPNPNNGIFTVRLPDYGARALRLRVLDLYGRVLSEQIVKTGTDPLVDVGDCPPGIYYLQVLDANAVLRVEKFVKY